MPDRIVIDCLGSDPTGALLDYLRARPGSPIS
jgi:hypothetical protein